MPGNQALPPAIGQTITLNPGGASISSDPYTFSSLITSGIYTVSATVPVNYNVGSTLCYNRTDCHTQDCVNNLPSCPVPGAWVAGSSRVINASLAGGNGYADLWWHYTPNNCAAPVVGAPAIDCSTSSINWSWNQVSGANSYEIDILESGGTTYQDNGWWPPSPPAITCAGGTCNYTTSSMPNGAFQARVRARNDAGGCQASTWATSSVTPLACLSTWFGGHGADIIAAGGDLQTTVPPAPLPAYVITNDLDSNFPGIGVGTRVQGNLTSSNISSTGWLIDNAGSAWSSVNAKPENQYQSLQERILAQVQVPVDFTATTLDQSQLRSLVDSAPATSRISVSGGDVTILRKTSGGTLTLTGPINLQARRALILVPNTDASDNDVLITGPTDQQALGVTGSGFLAIFAAEDIRVDQLIGDSAAGTDISQPESIYSPHLEGIFYAAGVFDTGSGPYQLRVDGTVIGMQTVILGRTHQGLTPAEFFYFRPDLSLTLHSVGLRRKVFQELVNP